MAMTLEFPRILNPTWFAYTAQNDHKDVSWESLLLTKRRCDVMCDSNNLKTNFYCLNKRKKMFF